MGQQSGAKVFVKPEQYQAVMQALDRANIVLRPSYVIVAKSFIPELEASIASIPSRKNVRPKSQHILISCTRFGGQTEGVSSVPSEGKVDQCRGLGSTPEEAVDVEKPLELFEGNEDWKDVFMVENTFLCTIRPFEGSDSVTQSTGEVHCSFNPRRHL